MGYPLYILAGLTVIDRRGDGARVREAGVSRVVVVPQNAGALLASARALV